MQSRVRTESGGDRGINLNGSVNKLSSARSLPLPVLTVFSFCAISLTTNARTLHHPIRGEKSDGPNQSVIRPHSSCVLACSAIGGLARLRGEQMARPAGSEIDRA